MKANTADFVSRAVLHIVAVTNVSKSGNWLGQRQVRDTTLKVLRQTPMFDTLIIVSLNDTSDPYHRLELNSPGFHRCNNLRQERHNSWHTFWQCSWRGSSVSLGLEEGRDVGAGKKVNYKRMEAAHS